MIIIAHRGDTKNHKENTIDAFLSAFDKGAQGIELDIHLHENKLIVVHDFLYDRNAKFPTLDEVLDKVSKRGRIEIEIKSFDTAILAPLESTITNYPKCDIELTSSETPLLSHIKMQFPNVPLGIILNDNLFEGWMTQNIVENKIAGWGKMSGANRLHVSLKVLSKFGGADLVSKLHEAGFVVHSHIFKTDHEKLDFETLISWGVDQCTLDNISLIEEVK